MKKTIFNQLETEHHELRKLLATASACPDSERKKRLEEIESLLVPHSRAEEKVLYALLKDRAEAKSKIKTVEQIIEGYEEHRVAEEILKTLCGTRANNEKWLGTMKVFRENIEHHLEEEENDLFPMAKKLFSQKEQEELRSAYLESKEGFDDTCPSQGQIKEQKRADSVQHL